jgi:hypothetical protein
VEEEGVEKQAMVSTAYRTKLRGFDAVQCTQANAQAIDRFLAERGAAIRHTYGDDGEYQLTLNLPQSPHFAHVGTGDWLLAAADGVIRRMDDFWFEELFEVSE